MTGGYSALRESAAWIDLSGRGLIGLTGEDRARLLHAMTTNHVQGLKPGEGCYAFFLSAVGRVLADANVLCQPDSIHLDTEAETKQKIYEHLDKYIIADDVTLEDLSAERGCVGVEGPRAEAVAEKLGLSLDPLPFSSTVWNGRLVARLSLTGWPGFRIWMTTAEKAAVVSELESAGVIGATTEEARVARIENGVPRYGEEISERFLAQETNQTRALNFNKGCYLGQEIVERVRSRGQVHRVLTQVRLHTTNPPEAGAKLEKAGAAAGEIASAAFSPALGLVVALAYVRNEAAEPGTEIAIGDVRGEVV